MSKLYEHRRSSLPLNEAVVSSLLVCLLVFEIDTPGARSDEMVRFNEDIRPILAEHCLHCHGPDKDARKGDLRLDEERAAKDHAIIAGNPDDSPLIKRLLTDDADERMPPP